MCKILFYVILFYMIFLVFAAALVGTEQSLTGPLVPLYFPLSEFVNTDGTYNTGKRIDSKTSGKKQSVRSHYRSVRKKCDTTQVWLCRNLTRKFAKVFQLSVPLMRNRRRLEIISVTSTTSSLFINGSVMN